MLNSVQAVIDIDNPKPIYTGGDVVSGRVIITNNKEASVRSIVLKHKVHASTRLHVLALKHQRDAGKRNPEMKEKTVTEDERYYHREFVLFPSKEIRESTSGKGFKLPAGRREYDFSITIPYETLPPSMVDPEGRGKIEHALKVTVSRPGALTVNTRVFKSINFTPSAPIEYLDVRELNIKRHPFVYASTKSGFFSRSRGPEIHGVIEAQFPPAIAQAPHHLPLRLKLSTLDGRSVVTVRNIAFTLVSHTQYLAQGHNQITTQKFPVASAVMQQTGSNLDLSGTVDGRMISTYLVPTFETKLISNAWHLVVQVTISDSAGGNPMSFELHDRVTVLPTRFFNATDLANQASQANSYQGHSVASSSAPVDAKTPEKHSLPPATAPPVEPQATSGYLPEKATAHQNLNDFNPVQPDSASKGGPPPGAPPAYS